MVNNNPNTLSIIKKMSLDLIPGSKVLLFGSRARNENSTDSDYDFLVITQQPIDGILRRNFQSMLRKELAKLKIPADILIQSEEEVAKKKDIIGHIIREIVSEGVTL